MFKRNDLYPLIFDLISNKKIPIVIGGDHSITTIALQAIGDALDKVGLILLTLTLTLYLQQGTTMGPCWRTLRKI